MSEVNTNVKNKTILLFDDDQDYLYQQKIRLEAAGFNVVAMDSASDADQVIADAQPDLLVVDLMMEDEDTGFTLCYKAKKWNSDVPVIIVTGVATETGIEFDTATGEEQSWIKADAILAKPIRFEQLQGEIARLLKLE